MKSKKLTQIQILTPQAHQRIINRLSAQLDPSKPVSHRNLTRKIEWHTDQFLGKTGQLPE